MPGQNLKASRRVSRNRQNVLWSLGYLSPVLARSSDSFSPQECRHSHWCTTRWACPTHLFMTWPFRGVASWRRKLRRLSPWQLLMVAVLATSVIYTLNALLLVTPLHPDIHLVDTHHPRRSYCMFLPHAPRPGLKLCLHPSSYLSEVLRSGSLYEAKFLMEMTKAFQLDPDMQLVDVGANIGLYTVWAASMDRKVLSVEMLQENLDYLQNSLHVNDLEDHVTLVQNAVFRGHRQVLANFIGTNIGETRLVMDPRDWLRLNVRKDPVMVQTICMDDLLPLVKSPSVYLKMDIEGSESRALECAGQFFSKANVKVVQMEWSYRRGGDVQAISMFMLRHGYVVSRRATRVVPVDINRPFVEGLNVFFLKYDGRQNDGFEGSRHFQDFDDGAYSDGD